MTKILSTVFWKRQKVSRLIILHRIMPKLINIKPNFDGKHVKTIDEVKTAWQQFADAGLLCAQHDYAQWRYATAPLWSNMALQCHFHLSQSVNGGLFFS